MCISLLAVSTRWQDKPVRTWDKSAVHDIDMDPLCASIDHSKHLYNRHPWYLV